ncbi:MAG TPA: IS1595 family transposase [Flavipsychrobacter sp.]|nr:IS1595 family transposase [Flavipsychrobacter sp.]
MFAQFKTLPQLFDFFKDEQTCLEYWEQIRWGGEPECPHCGHNQAYKTDRGYKCKNKECQKKFTSKVGSIFESSKLPLRTWFGAIYLCCNHKKGVSSMQIARDLGIHQKSAWFMLHRIRETFREINPQILGGEGVIVEADTTIVGGKAKNMHTKKRMDTLNPKRGGKGNKTHIAAYLERGGSVRMDVVDSHEKENELLVKHVCTSSVLMTDTAANLRAVGRNYAFHGVVDHSRDEYVCKENKAIHTNTVEGVFSQFDRMVMGTYHNISKKHMQAYANECAYRYNTRKSQDPIRFECVVLRCSGVRVKYNVLTGKA